MRALILEDIQNDFVAAGALPVPDGDAVVPVANRLMERFELVVATQDRHPAAHKSFASSHPGKQPGDVVTLHGAEQTLWPDHCVAGTAGAEFAPGLNVEGIERVFHKGTDPEYDSYSSFFDSAGREVSGLHDFLQERGVDELYILGLATDYCVKFTALDAVRLGYATYLVADGCRGVDLIPGDVDRAVEEMTAAGVIVVDSSEVAAAT